MTDRQLRAQEPAAPLGYPRRETEKEREMRIYQEVIASLVKLGYNRIDMEEIVYFIDSGQIPRLSISYEPGDDDTI